MTDYKTIKKEAACEFVEKRSRFLSYAKPVETEKQAIDFINQIKKKHYDAKHNVFAYVLREQNISRFSDDGEPSGTAGRPVLSVLQKRDLFDVAVVVTRYFGGVLLGTGGLVRAYGHSASLAIDEAQVKRMAYCSFLRLSFAYSFYGKIQSVILENGGIIMDTDFSQAVLADVYLPENRTEPFKDMLVEACLGDITIEQVKKGYMEV